jgi:tetratricopeptide (TPR) repeat protein
MPVDSYASCPCGSGKKLKFCCGAHWPEIEKIEKLYETRQEVAALDAIARLELTLPNHPHLMQLKFSLLMDLGRQEEAEAVCDALIAEHPDNAHAKFLHALRLAQEDPSAAVRAWYQAASDSRKTGLPYTALTSGRVVALALLDIEEFVAARVLFHLLAALQPNEESLKRMNAALQGRPEQPLILRELTGYVNAPTDASIAAEFAAAASATNEGRFAEAESLFAALAVKSPRDVAVWANLAKIRATLAAAPGAAEAYAALAACSSEWDDAVEAEALSLLYRDDLTGDIIERLLSEFEIQDVDRAIELLSSDPRFPRLPSEMITPSEDGSPPPRAVFRWIDRAPVALTPESTYEAIPTVRGELMIFGRETDRPARVAVEAFGAPALDEAIAAIRTTVGESLSALGEPRIIGSMLLDQVTLAWIPHLSPDASPDQVFAFNVGWHEHALRETWTQTKNRYLNGQTPAEAAADPEKRRTLAAVILLLEGEFEGSLPRTVFDQLRSQLGLPAAADIDPTALPAGKSPAQIPLVRLVRVDAAKLDDDALMNLLQRASMYRAAGAIARLGDEALRRTVLTDEDRVNVNLLMAQSSLDSRVSVARLVEAQRCVARTKRSPASLMLMELRLRFQRREPEHIERLLKAITTKHAREPGVMEAVASLLAELGLIGPDGRPVPMPASQQGLVLPGEEEAAGKLWTPETANTGTGKSALWMPGME